MATYALNGERLQLTASGGDKQRYKSPEELAAQINFIAHKLVKRARITEIRNHLETDPIFMRSFRRDLIDQEGNKILTSPYIGNSHAVVTRQVLEGGLVVTANTVGGTAQGRIFESDESHIHYVANDYQFVSCAAAVFKGMKTAIQHAEVLTV